MSDPVRVLIRERHFPKTVEGVSGRSVKQLLELYAETVNHDGRGACMSHQLAGDMMCLGRDAAKATQKAAETAGYIVRIAEQETASGGGKLPVWRIDLEKIRALKVIENAWQITADSRRVTASPDRFKGGSQTPGSTEGGVSDPPQGVAGGGLTPRRKANAGVSDPPLDSFSPSLRSGEKEKRAKTLFDTSKDIDPRFAGFSDLWKLWRPADVVRNSVRKTARQAYEQIIKASDDHQVTAGRIMAGARAHLANPEKTKDGGKYLGKLCKWLESEAWADLADEALAEREEWLTFAFEEGGEWNEAKLGPQPGRVEFERMRSEWRQQQERAM